MAVMKKFYPPLSRRKTTKRAGRKKPNRAVAAARVRALRNMRKEQSG